MFVGYRHNRREGIAPLFPFGFGLSYTTFAIEDVRLDAAEPADPESVLLHARIRNTGDRAGSEVLQLYVGESDPALPRPEAELHAFAKRHLQPGESSDVTLRLDARWLRYFDPDTRSWRYRPGRYQLRLGTSAEHILWQGAVELA